MGAAELGFASGSPRPFPFESSMLGGAEGEFGAGHGLGTLIIGAECSELKSIVMPDLIRHPVASAAMDSGSSLRFARNDGIAPFVLLEIAEQRRKITASSSEDCLNWDPLFSCLF